MKRLIELTRKLWLLLVGMIDDNIALRKENERRAMEYNIEMAADQIQSEATRVMRTITMPKGVQNISYLNDLTKEGYRIVGNNIYYLFSIQKSEEALLNPFAKEHLGKKINQAFVNAGKNVYARIQRECDPQRRAFLEYNYSMILNGLHVVEIYDNPSCVVLVLCLNNAQLKACA